jgi:hypothetical protein
MKIFMTIVGLTTALIIAGCGQQQSAVSSQEAIANSQTLPTPDQKADYLVEQANRFLDREQFDDAIGTAQHVLMNVDQNSQSARQTLDKARDELAKKAQENVNEMRNKLNSPGQ